MSTFEPETTVETFLPLEDDPPEPEEEVAAAEDDLEEFSAEDDLIVAQEPPPALGRSWDFDFAAGRFLGQARGPAATRGLQTLQVWIDKCMRTDRGAHPIHPDDYGVVDPFVLIGQPISVANISDYEDKVRDALTFHPRIADVRDFAVSPPGPEDDFVNVSFTVVLDDDVTFPFTIILP